MFGFPIILRLSSVLAVAVVVIPDPLRMSYLIFSYVNS